MRLKPQLARLVNGGGGSKAGRAGEVGAAAEVSSEKGRGGRWTDGQVGEEEGALGPGSEMRKVNKAGPGTGGGGGTSPGCPYVAWLCELRRHVPVPQCSHLLNKCPEYSTRNKSYCVVSPENLELDSVWSHLPNTWDLSLVKAVPSKATLLVEPQNILKKSALVACALAKDTEITWPRFTQPRLDLVARAPSPN